MQVSLISCDWGLSTFRIRLLAGSAVPEILTEYSDARGIAGRATRAPAEFSAALQEGIQALFQNAGATPQPLPVYLSGMICSSLGWKQLPYAPLPFPLDGSRAVIGRDALDCPWGNHPLTFVSGICSQDDAMRGEECEVVGIFGGTDARQFCEEAVAILPGTHSKCIEIHRGQVTDFRTFLTGELFELLCRHSVLRHSVGPDARVEADEFFDLGVRRSVERGLLGSLFSVRARDLLDGVDQARGRHYLSGLLIGDELAAAIASHPASVPLVLGGGSSLQPLYRRALDVLGAGFRIHAVPESVTSSAASLGHWQIFRARR